MSRGNLFCCRSHFVFVIVNVIDGQLLFLVSIVLQVSGVQFIHCHCSITIIINEERKMCFRCLFYKRGIETCAR